MDFPEKDVMGWGETPAGKQGIFDFPLFLPEFPFSGMTENPQFFYMPEGEFPMFQPKREEEAEAGNQLFFYQPELMYAMGEPPTGSSDWTPESQEKTKSSQKQAPTLKPRVPYPHAKKVGTISVEERRMKIERYLEKRSRRNYGKKVSYACRKRVADTRIRVKGRFVAKKIAEALKGMENEKNNVSLQPLK